MMIKLTTYTSLKSKNYIEPSLLLKLEMEDYYSFTIFNQTKSFLVLNVLLIITFYVI